jgi:hypothetical protein
MDFFDVILISICIFVGLFLTFFTIRNFQYIFFNNNIISISQYSQGFSDWCKKHNGDLRPESEIKWGQCLLPSGEILTEQKYINFVQ